MGENRALLEQGSFRALLARLCAPAVVITLVTVLYHTADTLFIGQTGDPWQMSGISLCAPVFSILSGLGTLLGSGGCICISLALGRGDGQRVRSVSSLCFYGALAVGAVFLAAVLLFLRPIAAALGADEITRTYVVSYLRILAFGAPVILFSNVFANLVRADGSTVRSMAANLAGTLTNIALDALFLLGFSWGVAGAAAATVIGNCVSAAVLVYFVRRRQPLLSLHPRDLTLRREVVLPVLTLGVPLACSTLLMSVSNIAANRLLAACGAVPVAAQSVASKVSMLLSMVLMGVCMGMQPALSYSFSSGNHRRLRSILQKTGIFAVVLGTALAAVCFLARGQIVRAFTPDAEVTSLAEIFTLAGVITGPFYGICQTCQTFLQSTGKAGYATLVSLLDKGLFYLPVLFAMHALLGMYGVVFAAPVTLVFSLAAAVPLSLRRLRRIPADGAGAAAGTADGDVPAPV